jgi:hypothetical protein
MTKLSDTQEKLISEVYNLKKDLAYKMEELQTMYLEHKVQRNLIDKISQMGCFCCGRPAEVHHIRSHTGLSIRPSSCLPFRYISYDQLP